ncbi:MAG: hypothetical protein JW973_09095 [Bacteroidales bacterium]|nr:hypothetical protein [Bacteroidales bacterium]
MKILYAIQGTGNGHISRAREIIPLLQKKCETDILISGYQSDMELLFEVKYRMHGLSLIFGKKGGVDIWKTYGKSNIRKLLTEIKELPVSDYDFVLNDFEPVSAWACYRNKIPCIALSHQSALRDKNAPKPPFADAFGKFIINYYAPSNLQFGLHFGRYSKEIYTPVIRSEVREAEVTDAGHYTVYLPAYSDEILLKTLENIPEVRWHVFSKHCKKPVIQKHILIKPISNRAFIKSMASSQGVLCGADFETPAEALFMGKKLMVIPMKSQYEQQCNAVALRAMGVSVLKKLKKGKTDRIKKWVFSNYNIEVNYPDITEKIINRIFKMYVDGSMHKKKWKKIPRKFKIR